MRSARATTPTSGVFLAIATALVVLAACGTTRQRSSVSPNAQASCASAYVDWLSLADGATCDAAKAVAGAIFMGDDGDVRSSFLQEDFSPLPTVKVAGVGYLPTRILRSWRCRYETRRSSYGVTTDGSPRLLYATCRLDARVVTMTTTVDQLANHGDS
jgi:hypothetical protein